MKVELPGRSPLPRLLAVTALPILLAAVYLLAIRPAQLRWGGLTSIVAGLALLWVARNG